MGYRTAAVVDLSPRTPPLRSWSFGWSPLAQLSLLLDIASGATSVHEATRRHGLAEEEVLRWQDALTAGTPSLDAEIGAVSLGALKVSSGHVALVDALGVRSLHCAEVPAGTHSVVVGTYAGVAAYVLLKVSDEGVAQWTQGATLEIPSGVAGLVDPARLFGLEASHQGPVADEVLHGRSVATLFRRDGARAGELAAVAAGQVASVRVGLDGFGDVACVLVDFHRVDATLGRDEASAEEQELVGSLSSFFSSGPGGPL